MNKYLDTIEHDPFFEVTFELVLQNFVGIQIVQCNLHPEHFKSFTECQQSIPQVEEQSSVDVTLCRWGELDELVVAPTHEGIGIIPERKWVGLGQVE